MSARRSAGALALACLRAAVRMSAADAAAAAAAVLVASVLVPVHFSAVALVILIARFAG